MQAEIRVVRESELVFLGEDEVAVLLVGYMILRNHSKSLLDASTIVKYGSGDIIGFEEIDGGISRNPESWLAA